MKNVFILSIISLLWMQAAPTFAQQSLLQSGPMLGYSEMREVVIWVQTNTNASVKAAYWRVDSSDAAVDTFYTNTVETKSPTAFTAHLLAHQVQPTNRYHYQVFINGVPLKFDYDLTFQSQPLWQYRFDPPPFKFALGSCAYINEERYDRKGKSYGGNYEVFTSIADKQPNMMLWMGDNIYLREPDWNTWTGILGRYTHTRSLPEMQRLLATAHNYATWDDHDFGPNDADRSFVHKDKTLKAFQLFWANPSYGVMGQKGITSQFKFHDVEFFVLDNRYFRSPNNRKTGERTILGKHQVEWLIDALSSSRAPFKMVMMGGQFLSSYDRFENYSTFPDERNYILKRLQEENIKGVIFLSGDRHQSELSQYVSATGWTCYDLTVSPLTAGVRSDAVPEDNRYRVEGTWARQRGFGIVEVTGKRKERQLSISLYDSNGDLIWNRKIDSAEFYGTSSKK